MGHIFEEIVVEARRKVSPELPAGTESHSDPTAVDPSMFVTSRQIDVDEEPDLADAARADRIPLITVSVGGVEKLRLTGARPKRELRGHIAKVLGERWQDETTRPVETPRETTTGEEST